MQKFWDKVNKAKVKGIRLTKRIHIFYEGDVSEKGLLLFFNEELIKKDLRNDILNMIKIEMADKGVNDLTHIIKFIQKKEDAYFNHLDDVVSFEEDDIVIYFYDFDVYHDYNSIHNPDNEKRIFKAKKRFKELFEQIKTDDDLKYVRFSIIPSFPSIEYPIVLGILNEEDLYNIEIESKKNCLEVIRDNTGLNLKNKDKNFKELFEHPLFSITKMMDNCLQDRRIKLLPLTVEEFNNELLISGVEKFVRNKNKPFSYIDGISQIIEKLIE